MTEVIQNRVAVGDYSPTAPTDPYVRHITHTVPQIMALLRLEAENAWHEPEQAGNAGANNRISSSASSGGRCGDQAAYTIDSRRRGDRLKDNLISNSTIKRGR
jgi:hypothetical protein